MTSLAKKLQMKPGKLWLLYNAPANYLTLLEPLPDATIIAYEANNIFDGVQLFVKNNSELKVSLKIIIPVLKPGAVFWVIYPKKSSGMVSDLEMMSSWDELANYGFGGVAAAAIDETWTALRFRPVGQSKTSDANNKNIRQNEYGAYIDVDRKQIILPADIAELLQQNPKALAFYEQLSYSNKKEYVLWILTAKQEKTKIDRLGKLVEKLLDKKKNPAEK